MLDEQGLLKPRLPAEANARARAEALIDCYRRIDTEVMGELPVSNHALKVEVVGLHDWHGGWLGVLVTPWMMSYVRLPGIDEPDPVLETGAKITEIFPAGSCELVLERQPELGWYLLCPLYSPMGGFESPLHARATATVALHMLLTPPKAAPPATAAVATAATATAAAATAAAAPPPPAATIGRRALFGRRPA